MSLCTIDQAVLDGIPAALYVCSPDGAVLRFNRRAVELWGQSPDHGPQATFGGALKLYQLNGRPLALGDGPMGVALRTGEPRRDGRGGHRTARWFAHHRAGEHRAVVEPLRGARTRSRDRA
jgi:PAS domain-containing protein